jgi:hypothetical protein
MWLVVRRRLLGTKTQFHHSVSLCSDSNVVFVLITISECFRTLARLASGGYTIVNLWGRHQLFIGVEIVM